MCYWGQGKIDEKRGRTTLRSMGENVGFLDIKLAHWAIIEENRKSTRAFLRVSVRKQQVCSRVGDQRMFGKVLDGGGSRRNTRRGVMALSRS